MTFNCLKQSMKDNPPKNWVCTNCDKRFETRKDLKTHWYKCEA